MSLSPRWRKVIRDLWFNRARTALVVVSIAVGVFAVGAILSARHVMQVDLLDAFAATNPPHAELGGRFDEETLNAVRNMRGVDTAELRTDFYVDLYTGSGGPVAMELVVIPDFLGDQIGIVNPQQGEWPPRRRDVLIERSSLAFAGVAPGDTITVEDRSGVTYTLNVVGTAHDMDRVAAEFDSRATGYISLETMRWMGVDRFDELHLRFTGSNLDKEHNRLIAERVRDQLVLDGVNVSSLRVNNPNEHTATETVDALLVVLGSLGSMALLLSGALVVNTITAILAQHKRQIGIMKAVGARAHQVVGMYVVVVACFGILSLFVALPTGALGSLLITNYAASRVNFDLISPPLPLRVVAVQAAVAVIVPTIAAMVPVFSGTAVTVREAISDYGLGGGAHPAWIDRLAERVRMLPRPFLLSLRNTFRRKARLALTLVTLTLAGAIFISVFSVQESLELTLEDALGYYGFDAQVTLGGAFRAERIEREALRVPGVLAVESWRTAGGYRIRPGGQEGDYLSLIGVPAETRMLNPIMVEGRWLLPADEAAIVVNTDFLKNEPDVGLGDEVMLEIGGRESRFTVVGVAQAILTGPSAYINYPHLAEVLRGIGRVDRILVAAEGETAHERIALADLLEERLRRLGITGAAGSTTDADRQEIEYQFDILIVFMFIMAAILTIVGGLGLAGTIGINVLERTREIGVMRAVGASDGAIRFIVMMEAIIIGAIAWVVGVVVALPMSRWLSDTIGITFLDDPLSYTFSLGGVFVWLGLTALLACVASYVPARRASRLSVREVIAYE